MKHDDWVKWCDQMETSLTRATINKKDGDLTMILRLAWEICVDKVKETAPKREEKERESNQNGK